MDKKLHYVHTIEHFSSIKEHTIGAHNMDESQNIYTSFKKPELKGYNLYDSIYIKYRKWQLICSVKADLWFQGLGYREMQERDY